jgi:hypothetical protein
MTVKLADRSPVTWLIAARPRHPNDEAVQVDQAPPIVRVMNVPYYPIADRCAIVLGGLIPYGQACAYP